MSGLASEGRKAAEDSGDAVQLICAVFVTSDCSLLATLAVDCYMAICNPLHDPTVMLQRACIPWVVGSYITGFINASVKTGFTFPLSFCKSNAINHFFV